MDRKTKEGRGRREGGREEEKRKTGGRRELRA